MLRDFCKVNSKLKGFTLVEIMVTLVVLAIVAVLAVPNFRNFVQSNNINASANNLMGSLSLARSEAIKRNMPVTICASSSQTGCTGVDWNNGWIVFTDTPASGIVDGEDELLSAIRGLPGGMELMANEPYIQFKPNGALAACYNCVENIPSEYLTKAEKLQQWTAQLLYSFIPGKLAWATGSGHDPACQPGPQYRGGANCRSQDTPSAPAEPRKKFGTEFVFCDANQIGETGQRIFISLSGQITRSTITCN